MRLLENAHLLRYPHPSSLRRTSLYASFLGISSRSKACGMDIFHQPLRGRFFYSLVERLSDTLPSPQVIRSLPFLSCDPIRGKGAHRTYHVIELGF